ncbi:MAG TPA: GNAT family N-acetyltransferase [Rhizomicrobium sp.]|jgi:ribosomal protein S18 acetylase RimI-like enzyme|nr:GNAT family N-acetyltransferase [Rhizomicrobium sp.]
MSTAHLSTISLRPANFDDLDTVVALFREYAASLDIDLCFQNFEDELESLPGAYAPPKGSLLLAEIDGKAVGCVAVRALHATNFCEMKRLYVQDSARGTGAGRALAEGAVAEARRLNYDAMRLDTLSTMQAALTLYRSLGFKEIAAYYETPVGNTVFLQKDLAG